MWVLFSIPRVDSSSDFCYRIYRSIFTLMIMSQLKNFFVGWPVIETDPGEEGLTEVNA